MLLPAALLHKVDIKGGYAVFIGLQAVSAAKSGSDRLFLAPAFSLPPQLFHHVTASNPAVGNDMVMNTNGVSLFRLVVYDVISRYFSGGNSSFSLRYEIRRR